jgi:hypothetical protein
VHLVNATGHSDTAYFPPVELRDIRIELAGDFTRAKAMGAGMGLQVTGEGRYRAFTLPILKAYEVVVVE